MRILSSALAVPTRKLSNEDLLNYLSEKIHLLNSRDKENYQEIVKLTLERNGANTRYWCDTGEYPWQLTDNAIHKCLAQAKVMPSDVDLLIYAAVSKGVSEPGQSFIVAKRLGMKSPICFDIQEACNGFTRSLEIVHGLMQQGSIHTALIVSGEFWMQDNYPVKKNFSPQKLQDINWLLPSYTFGEAAAAMLLCHDKTKQWRFMSTTDTDLIETCVMTQPWNREFNGENFNFSDIKEERFICYGKELHFGGRPTYLKLIEKFYQEHKKILRGDEIVIPHSSTKRAWENMLNRSALKNFNKYFIFPEYGNIVTATLPVAVSLLKEKAARKEILLPQRFIYTSGAAGYSAMIVSGEFN